MTNFNPPSIEHLEPQQQLMIVLGVIEVAESYYSVVQHQHVLGKVIIETMHDLRELLKMELRRHARP